MAIIYGAILTKDNYDAFRRVLAGAPATFQEWCYRRDQRAADAVSKRWEFIEVEVDLQEFIRDCDATRSPYDLNTLDNFAFKVAQRKKE